MVGVASERLVRVAIVGGTGSFGRALARKLRGLGHDVAVGSRDAQRGRERAIELGVEGGANEDVVRGADLVILATKSNGALDTARDLVDAIGETPVLSVASDLAFTDVGVLPGRAERSLAEELNDIVRGPVASGLQSLSAAHLAADGLPDEDALICGDDARAKELALELAERLVGGHAVDVGPLANSRALEAMTAVLLNVNREFGVTAGLRLTGLP
jgi:8-hydroxy-5-deazaflavin:NADPH oxidoreductase